MFAQIPQSVRVGQVAAVEHFQSLRRPAVLVAERNDPKHFSTSKTRPIQALPGGLRFAGRDTLLDVVDIRPEAVLFALVVRHHFFHPSPPSRCVHTCQARGEPGGVKFGQISGAATVEKRYLLCMIASRRMYSAIRPSSSSMRFRASASSSSVSSATGRITERGSSACGPAVPRWRRLRRASGGSGRRSLPRAPRARNRDGSTAAR